jgi:hypothetical protein
MADKINPGSVLVKQGVRLPKWPRLESEPFSDAWRLVQNFDAHGLDRKMRDLGWSFVHLAEGEVKATAVGLDRQETVHRAARRGFAKLKAKRSNSLEVSRVMVKRFLGLLIVTVSARPRLIQEDVALPPNRNLAEWRQAKLVGA